MLVHRVVGDLSWKEILKASPQRFGIAGFGPETLHRLVVFTDPLGVTSLM